MSELYSFCLVGGTSLALQIGHRSSVDIDLFANKAFNSPALQSLLHNQFKQFTITWINQSGFRCIINGVKTDFFNWNVPFILPYYEEDNIRLMPKEEIAAMKFEAITSRKEKKDFYDIAFLLKEYTFRQLFDIFLKKYEQIEIPLLIDKAQKKFDQHLAAEKNITYKSADADDLFKFHNQIKKYEERRKEVDEQLAEAENTLKEFL